MAKKSELSAILERLALLEARIAHLEGENQAALAVAADFRVAPVGLEPAAQPAVLAPTPGAEPAVRQGGSAPAEELPEEILLVISAAVAAFLGERAHVRQVRLLHSDAWAQQGRVSVMASHRWAVHR